jgi:hypothetical protein
VKLTNFRLLYRVDEVGQGSGLVVGHTKGTSGPISGKTLVELEPTALGVVGTFQGDEKSSPAVRMLFAPGGHGELIGTGYSVVASKGGKS